ncbi:DUF3800 domain-containing protein [Rhodobacter sp. 24-YEA-8]|uniref:DUF3800 domain-containing protein n=1 Tax=Rhodobacter sp. 24-YEA-8 TaxID=1884310 RepID=UPI00089CD2D5|nr:DUF3800 domain-containing protein [Rhodobacter sp. 24-YEA-8]SED17762.1 Protein of unknown function [Rhodobacter sp. 24-YEA-8]
MKICYIDEAGCTGMLPAANSAIQPTLVIVGVIVDYGKLHDLTDGMLNLKKKYFPNLAPSKTTHMGWMLHEIKGSEIRKNIATGSRNQRRHGMTFLTEVMNLCDQIEAKLVGRVWVKGVGAPIDGTAIYTYSVQSIYTSFQNFLVKHSDMGFVVADSRIKHLNTQVAHSIFTQKFKGSGDAYDRIIELPAFSHSDNHAGLQLADALCSGIITPMAISTYCEGHLSGPHIRPRYVDIKSALSAKCMGLQHRFQEANGRHRGGLVVSDLLGQQSGGRLFKS